MKLGVSLEPLLQPDHLERANFSSSLTGTDWQGYWLGQHSADSSAREAMATDRSGGLCPAGSVAAASRRRLKNRRIWERASRSVRA